MRWFGVVWGHSRSLEIAPFDRACTSSYKRSVVTMSLSRNVLPAQLYASAGIRRRSVSVCVSVCVCLYRKLAKKVQLALIGSRPRAFQRSIDEPCTLPLSPQKMA